jgi:hypothetical protein
VKGDGRFRYAGILLFCAVAGIAQASSPPPDSSPGFFAGEWAGTGDQGSYCYLDLSADGWGWVLVDGGGGDWLGARIRWHNRQQSLQIDKIIPLQESTELRVMRLGRFVLGGGFNQSLRLTWKELPGGCELQRVESTATRLSRARTAVKSLRPAGSVR